MQAGYELFDHTADLGIRATAPTLAGLIQPAAEGLYAVIGELVAGADLQPGEWAFEGGDPAVLLRDYLGELLVLFEQRRRMVVKPDIVEFTNERLAVRAGTAVVDEARSAYHREVKAVTYHLLEIVDVPGGFQATVIVDI